MRIATQVRHASAAMRWSVSTSLIIVTIGVAGLAGQQRGRGATPPATKAPPAPAKAATPPPAPVPPMQISVTGIRVIGAGLGANGSELHAFNDRPGTSVALAIVAPSGTGIVEIDDHGSRVDTFSDDKGQSLLEEGRFGPFPKLTEDHTAALVDVEVRGRPSPGAASLSLQGTVAMTLANGSKPTRLPNIRLAPATTMKLGTATITVKTATPSEDSTEITLALSRLVMNTINTVRFYDSKGVLIESRRTGSGYMNDAAEVEFRLKSLEKVVAVEFDVWQNLRQVKVPFNMTAGLSMSGDNRPVPAADAASTGRQAGAAPASAPPTAASRPSGPPRVAPGPNDGAATVEAVVKQLQTAATAAKGRDVLAVVYPDDRGTFGQGLAMMVTFSVLGQMGDEKAADKSQKEIDALFTKHKLKMPLSKEPDEIFKDTDLAAFTSDMLTYMKAHVPPGQNAADALPVPKGTPSGVKIDGDSATAKLGDRDVKFVRINNKWFIRVTD